MIYVSFKKLTKTAEVPSQGSCGAAGYDLCADPGESSVTIRPGECIQIGTGLAVEIPRGWFGAIYARSGLALKQGLRPPMCVGIIDSDYRGEVMVPLYNDSSIDQVIVSGQRIAQMIIQRCESVIFSERDELSPTGRGDGGFGSTGT